MKKEFLAILLVLTTSFTEDYLYEDAVGTPKEGKQEYKVSGLYDINGTCI